MRKEADEPKSKGSDINTLVCSTVPSLVVLAADEIANQRAKENDPAMAKSYASSQLSVDESSPDSSSNDSISDVEAREPAIQPKNDESGSGQMPADESSSNSSSNDSISDVEAREPAIQPKSDEPGSGQMLADESSSDSSSYEAFFYVN